MMIVDNKYKIGQLVYLATDKEYGQMIILEIRITPKDIMYLASRGNSSSWYYEFELTTDLVVNQQ